MSATTVGSRVSRDRTIFIAPKCTARRRILIAGMGTSPAVRAETVWRSRTRRMSLCMLIIAFLVLVY